MVQLCYPILDFHLYSVCRSLLLAQSQQLSSGTLKRCIELSSNSIKLSESRIVRQPYPHSIKHRKWSLLATRYLGIMGRIAIHANNNSSFCRVTSNNCLVGSVESIKNIDRGFIIAWNSERVYYGIEKRLNVEWEPSRLLNDSFCRFVYSQRWSPCNECFNWPFFCRIPSDSVRTFAVW